MKNDEENNSIFVSKIVVAVDGNEVLWFNEDGKQIYKSSLSDKLDPNYYISGYTIIKNEDSPDKTITYIASDGNVIVEDVKATTVSMLTCYDKTNKEIKYFYNIKKEIIPETKKPESKDLFHSALFDGDGNEIFGFSEKVSEVKNIYQNKNGDVLAIIGKQVGGDDCNPIFNYGVYNISNKTYEHAIDFDLVEKLKFSKNFGENKYVAYQNKAIEIVNSDRVFKTVEAFKDTVEKIVDKEKYTNKEESRTFLILAKDSLFYFYENEKLLKKVVLPSNLKPTAATYHYSSLNLSSSYNPMIKRKNTKKTAVFNFLVDGGNYIRDPLASRGGGRKSYYLKIDDADDFLYVTLPYDERYLPFMFDSLHYKMICVGDNLFNVIDSNKKVIFQDDFNEIKMNGNDENPVFYVSKDGLKGVYSVYGEKLIPMQYENISTKNEVNFYIVQKEGKYIMVNSVGKEVIPATDNELTFVKINNQTYVKEFTEVFSRLTNKREYQVVSFYNLMGKKINGK